MYPHHVTYSGKNRIRQAVATFVLATLLVFVTLGATSAQVADANVTLSVRIAPSVAATFTDEGVIVRANTPWQVDTSIVGDHGQDQTLVKGGPTPVGGTLVPIGPNESVVSVITQ